MKGLVLTCCADEWLTLVNRFCASPPWSPCGVHGAWASLFQSCQEIDINQSGGIDKEEFLGWVFETNNFRPSDKVQQRTSSKMEVFEVT